MLRVCPQRVADYQLTNTKESQNAVANDSILRVEGNRKHITILDSENSLQTHLKVGVSAPKVYAFDAVFPEDVSQVCVIHIKQFRRYIASCDNNHLIICKN